MKFPNWFLFQSTVIVLLLCLGCSKEQSYEILKMPSGSQYKVLGIGVSQSPLVDGKSCFFFVYQTDNRLFDSRSIQREISELEGYLVMNAEMSKLNFAIIEVHDSPPKYFGISASIGYIYVRNADGLWHRKGDTTIVRAAKPMPHPGSA